MGGGGGIKCAREQKKQDVRVWINWDASYPSHTFPLTHHFLHFYSSVQSSRAHCPPAKAPPTCRARSVPPACQVSAAAAELTCLSPNPPSSPLCSPAANLRRRTSLFPHHPAARREVNSSPLASERAAQIAKPPAAMPANAYTPGSLMAAAEALKSAPQQPIGQSTFFAKYEMLNESNLGSGTYR